MTRGEVFRLPPPRRARGHEQQGPRYAVVVQADELIHLGTVMVAPTSTGSWPASFRPTITLDGSKTRVLVEQAMAVDRRRLGRLAGRLDASEQGQVDEALQLVLAL